ncbi:hypothetical protein ARMSODRAFT_541512 [Armillaria solidipes]|uniref:Heterokaryon incompatibility domain-containing protein n=1 Tax=Armillaria solidipes TaxID=1076256 RepID=A0A2H3AXE1_9AGAR|nr:hypothetical protein ARMSODRAFT_541512 [Armillaria solidipes]
MQMEYHTRHEGKRWTAGKYHKVTVSALTEAGRDESTIPVPNQRAYCGTRPVISSALADTPCVDLGVVGLLKKLNASLDTSHELNTVFSPEPHLTSSRGRNPMPLEFLLEACITQNYDFGIAYAYLRYGWEKRYLPVAFSNGGEVETERNDLIKPRNRNPRRVWDLYANRVVPYWIWSKGVYGISHAWMDVNDRENVWTPINGYRWPVPIPKDSNLHLIRIEMLNLGANLVWLDVLCLRQKYDAREDHLAEDLRREDLRKEEWKTDVPTIGHIYQSTRQGWSTSVVCYFSGLGRPLSLKESDFESPRCWFNRAWTLQEITKAPIIGGETGDNVMMEEGVRMRFRQKLESLQLIKKHGKMFDFLSEMQKRKSTKPLDKVAGLTYLFCSEYSKSHIPEYRDQQSDEQAWTALVNVMLNHNRAHLLFFYPEPGDGSVCWRPSWKQIMTKTLPSPSSSSYGMESGIDHFGSVIFGSSARFANTDTYRGHFINSGEVRGLADRSQDGTPRQGELVVKGQTVRIVADHAYQIPNGSYALIGRKSGGHSLLRDPEDLDMKDWVIGWCRQDDKFEKLSIFSIVDVAERRKLQQLGVTKPWVWTILL